MRTDDGSIIYDCLNGKPEAFGMLIDKYKEGIYAFVYSEIRNFQDAQDVTQEVFIQAYQDLRNLKRWESFSFWLYRIARRKCISWFRDRTKRVDHDFIDDQEQNKIDIPSLKSYQDDRLAESVQEALNTLPSIYREALILHYFGGMKSEEIAESLGISPTAIRMRLSRAREQLKEEMVAMIDMAFDGQRLKAGFTFRIIEAIKRVKIQPVSQAKSLPWGLSLGAGLIFAVLMLGHHIPFDLPDITMGLPLPSDTKILKVGEIPVEAVKISTIASIADKGDGKGFAPDPKGQENAFMAPQAEGGKWEKKADMPTGRLALSVVEANGKIYAIGGFTPGGVSSIVEEYDPELNKWTKKADMITKRGGHCSIAVNGKIYTIGGWTSPTVEEYDPINDKWVQKTSMPSMKSYFSAVSINDDIYIFGGYEDINNPIPSLSVYIYNTTLDKWSKLDDLHENFAIAHSSAIVYNDNVYFFGGLNIANFQFVKNILMYNIKTQRWKMLKPSVIPRCSGVAEIIDNIVYFIGGDLPWEAWKGVPDVEEYNFATDNIIKKTDMPHRRGRIAGCQLDGKIYVIGGTTDWPGNLPNDYLSIVEVYTPDSIKSISQQGKLPQTWGTLKAK
ncbi:TPA: sigma-70 family RNA polymerase sigma factor [bacterium]|nr:sigma-70 family RNA polymerase sigma factor [bacterium]